MSVVSTQPCLANGWLPELKMKSSDFEVAIHECLGASGQVPPCEFVILLLKSIR